LDISTGVTNADLGIELDWERDEIRKRQRFLGKLLTDPSKTGKPMTCKKYHLRGISTSTDAVYVCRRTPRAKQVLIEIEDEEPPKDQWWMLAYSEGDANPVVAVVRHDFTP
jgi:hypothetical protein